MARIRTLKPEFFRSRSLAKCGVWSRLTFQGLWAEADDHGHGIADALLLKGSIWPLDKNIDANEVEMHLIELADTGHITLYEVEGERFYEVINWEKHQAAAYRRGQALHPYPPGRTPLHADVCKNVLEHGREGNVEQGTGNRDGVASSDTEEFSEFWDLYPRKSDDDGEARRAFRSAKAQPGEILAGLKLWCAYWRADGTSEQFINLPKNFLVSRKWREKPPAVSKKDQPRPEPTVARIPEHEDIWEDPKVVNGVLVTRRKVPT